MRRFARVGAVAAVLYLGLGALTYLGFMRTPVGFVPAQDKYYLVGIAQLPDAASPDRTEAVARQMTEILRAEPGVDNVVAFPGLSINGFASIPNAAVVFVMLDPFDQRASPELAAGAIAGRVNQKPGAIQEGFAAVFPPPPVPGLGALGGFKLEVQDRGGHGSVALFEATQKLLTAASQRSELVGLFSSFQVNVPQVGLDVDRDRVKAYGLAMSDVHAALQANLGSLYVNDVTFFGRIYRVFVQADATFRSDESALQHLKVRNREGQFIPLASVVQVKTATGPDRIIRHNAYPSADLNGNAAPGVSSGQAQALMEQLAREVLPAGFSFEWTDLAYQQKLAGQSGVWIFGLCVLFAYLILAAQYNSWSLPLAVLLIVPLTLLSALVGVWLTGGDNNLFTQIGLVVLVGLLRQQRELLERSLNTTQLHLAAGRGSALDTARAQALLKETEAALPLAEREEAQHLHRLAVLLGEQPGTFSLEFGPREAVQPARQIAIGNPAALLRRRPDVSAAERQLAAATARLGVRTAEMFPEVSVSGFIRLIGSEGISLGSAASQAWGVAPTATWHVFSLGRLNAVRNASRFQVNAAVDYYEQTVLRALEDMENSLLRYRTADERLRLLGERQSAADRAHRIAQDQYQAGAISSLEATDAERTALAAVRETTGAATEHRLAVVAVYKALGGGWNDEQLWACK